MIELSLGAIPIVAQMMVTLISGYLKARYSELEAAQLAAAEYKEFVRFQEAQLTPIALELARTSDKSSWEWMNILKTAQKYPMIVPKTPDVPNNALAAALPAWTWYAVFGAAAIALIFLVSGR